jgi:hypothetical protein
LKLFQALLSDPAGLVDPNALPSYEPSPARLEMNRQAMEDGDEPAWSDIVDGDVVDRSAARRA